MNGKDLLEKLKFILTEEDVSQRDFAWENLEEATRDRMRDSLGEFKHIHTVRTEGSGDWDGAQAVYHFTDHNVYISVEGYYSSEGGMDFDDGFYVVEPVEVTTTVYNIVK